MTDDPITTEPTNGNLPVYDPRGIVEAEPVPISPRPQKLTGLRLGVLDNSKWNAGRLLRETVAILRAEHGFSAVSHYTKPSFSLAAEEAMIAEIAAANDLVLTAIGD